MSTIPYRCVTACKQITGLTPEEWKKEREKSITDIQQEEIKKLQEGANQ